jgi:hypothetical protein
MRTISRTQARTRREANESDSEKATRTERVRFRAAEVDFDQLASVLQQPNQVRDEVRHKVSKAKFGERSHEIKG